MSLHLIDIHSKECSYSVTLYINWYCNRNSWSPIASNFISDPCICWASETEQYHGNVIKLLARCKHLEEKEKLTGTDWRINLMYVFWWATTFLLWGSRAKSCATMLPFTYYLHNKHKWTETCGNWESTLFYWWLSVNIYLSFQYLHNDHLPTWWPTIFLWVVFCKFLQKCYNLSN